MKSYRDHERKARRACGAAGRCHPGKSGSRSFRASAYRNQYDRPPG